jgi:hypothetical protein
MKFESGSVRGYEDSSVWKDTADRKITPRVIREIWKDLKNHSGIIPGPESQFIFLSPTANIGTHEEVIFQEDAKTRRGRGTFFVGDKARLDIPEHRKSAEINGNVLQYVRLDAGALPFPTDDAEKGTQGRVDMIWDRKGWLWRVAEKENASVFLEALNAARGFLKPGGCIVIDDIERWKYQRVDEWRGLIPRLVGAVKYARANRTLAQHEPSTVEKINKLRQSDGSSIWPEIDKLFERIPLSKGASKVLVLRKKAN